MSDRIKKKELVHRLAQRMETDETQAEKWLDAVTDSVYESIREGKSVTLPGLGGFYVKPNGASWVFKFNPAQKLRALFGWSSSYKGDI